MKKIVIINSHRYSGSTLLYQAMCNHSLIQGYDEKRTYFTAFDLLEFNRFSHKIKAKSAIYLREVLSNQYLSTKMDYSKVFFIHIIRRPIDTLNFLINEEKMSPSFALRHYCFRLRRICEIAKRTSNSVLFTYEDLKKPETLSFLESILGLKTKIDFLHSSLRTIEKEWKNNLISFEGIKSAEDCYERHFYYLSQLKNVRKLID
jgi:hypothetical protein